MTISRVRIRSRLSPSPSPAVDLARRSNLCPLFVHASRLTIRAIRAKPDRYRTLRIADAAPHSVVLYRVFPNDPRFSERRLRELFTTRKSSTRYHQFQSSSSLHYYWGFFFFFFKSPQEPAYCRKIAARPERDRRDDCEIIKNGGGRVDLV